MCTNIKQILEKQIVEKCGSKAQNALVEAWKADVEEDGKVKIITLGKASAATVVRRVKLPQIHQQVSCDILDGNTR